MVPFNILHTMRLGILNLNLKIGFKSYSIQNYAMFEIIILFYLSFYSFISILGAAYILI